ncbi:MAG: hypothetical protein FLDDKLPJ_02387 [Phycisphaerae bacterium]|nr:hypothetical protein [Phycisphaerae bacterium]
MEKVTQFSIFLANKAGVLSRIFREMARTKVNISALAMMDAAEHGVLRMVTDEPETARRTLGSLNLPITETDCLAVTLANRPGAVADICEKLANEHINVSYLYCTTGAAGGKTLAVLKVPDIKKAMKVLENNKPASRDEKPVVRSPRMKVRR